MYIIFLPAITTALHLNQVSLDGETCKKNVLFTVLSMLLAVHNLLLPLSDIIEEIEEKVLMNAIIEGPWLDRV